MYNGTEFDNPTVFFRLPTAKRMFRFLTVTLMASLACSALIAQQPADSTGNLPPVVTIPDTALTSFTGNNKELNKVVLQWQVSVMHDGDYFAVERSNNGAAFETIGVIKQADGASRYELVDSAPPNGTNTYRVKYIHSTGNSGWSGQLQFKAGQEYDFKFYPNPADKVLIIRTGHHIDIQVIDALGNVKLSKELQAGLQVINVSSLDKGNYVLRINDHDSNRVISEHFLKN
jgi:hypothetical protein